MCVFCSIFLFFCAKKTKKNIKKTGCNEESEYIRLIEKELTIIHFECLKKFMEKYKIKKNDIKLIAFHGQTIYHSTNNDNDNDNQNNHKSNENNKNKYKYNIDYPSSLIMGYKVTSWQIGNGFLLSQLCGMPVIYNLRMFDILNQGNGAPLIPIYHTAIIHSLKFKSYNNDQSLLFEFPIAIVNIGGVSNITYIDIKNKNKNNKNNNKNNNQNSMSLDLLDIYEMIAFDSGIGNAFLDDFISLISNHRYQCDFNAMFSKHGNINYQSVHAFMQHPYFNDILPPKSLDRNDLHSHLLKCLNLPTNIHALFVSLFAFVFPYIVFLL